MIVNERLKDLRTMARLTRKEVAERLGLDQTTYGKYELGKTQPSIAVLDKIAFLYSVSTDYLLGLTENPNKGRISGSGDFIVHNNRLAEYDDLPEEGKKELETYLQFLCQKYNIR